MEAPWDFDIIWLWALSACVVVVPLAPLLSPALGLPPCWDYSDLEHQIFLSLGIGAISAGWFLTRTAERRLVFSWAPSDIVFAGLALWVSLALLWATNLYEAHTIALNWCIAILVYFLVLQIVEGEHRARFLLTACLVSGTLVVLIGLAQHYFAYGGVQQLAPPSSTFANKNHAAHFAELTWPIGAVWFLVAKRCGWRPACAALAATLAAVYAFHTGSQGAWVSVFTQIVCGAGLTAYLVRRFGLCSDWPRGKTVAAICLVFLFLAGANLGKGLRPDWRFLKACQSTARGVARLLGTGEPATKRERSHAKEQLSPPHPSPVGVGDTGDRPPPDAGQVMTAEADRTRVVPPSSASKKASTDPYTGSLRPRIPFWVNSLWMIRDHLLAGVGPGNWLVMYPPYSKISRVDSVLTDAVVPRHAHNDYIQMLCELGLVGTALGLLAMATTAVYTWAALRDKQTDGAVIVVLLGSLLSLVGIAVHAAFSFPAYRALPPGMVMLHMGVIASVTRSQVAKKGPLLLRARRTAVPHRVAVALSMAATVTFIALAMHVSSLRQADVHFRNMMAYSGNNDYEKTRQAANLVLRYQPSRKKALLYAGKAHIDHGNRTEGLKLLGEFLRAYPDYNVALINATVAYVQLGQLDQAEKLVDRLLEIYPPTATAWDLKASIRSARGDSEGSYHAYLEAEQAGITRAEVFSNYALLLWKRGQHEKARDCFRKAITLKPSWLLPRLLIGELCLSPTLQAPTEAKTHLLRALELQPSPNDKSRIEALLLRCNQD